MKKMDMSHAHCSIEYRKGLFCTINEEEDVDIRIANDKINEYRKKAVLFAGKHDRHENVLYSVKIFDEELDTISKIILFADTYISREEIDELIRRYPAAEFGILYSNNCSDFCKKAWEEEKSKHIAPITLKEANSFVVKNHRHHDSVTGCKFAIGLYKNIKGTETLIGTAICGRPVSRILDDGRTLEINRLCVTEDGNSCSMLYGACGRVAKEMGYKKIITYILESETGISLKASNFTLEDKCCGGKNWTGKRKRTDSCVPEEMKQRWVKNFV